MLWWAGVFSFMSVQGQFVLRGLLAWDLTEREGALGLVYLVFGLTMLVGTPFGGVVADRLAKRSVLLWSQSLIFVAAAAMAFVVLTNVVTFWMLLLASMAQGLAFAFYGPARIAMAAELVGRDQLGNAITRKPPPNTSFTIPAPTATLAPGEVRELEISVYLDDCVKVTEDLILQVRAAQ